MFRKVVLISICFGLNAFADSAPTTSSVATPADASARGFDSDRPSFTDSPHTLSPRHSQFEVGAVSYSRSLSTATDNSSSLEKSASTYGSLAFRYGLTSKLEAQATFDGYSQINSRTTVAGQTTPSSVTGPGNSGLRAKWNLFGNDGGDSILGALAAIRLPTGSSSIANRKFEFGFELPYNYQVNSRFGIAFMPAWNKNTNDDGINLHNEFSAGIVFLYNLADRSLIFAQLFSINSDQVGYGTATSAGVGLTYKVCPRLQLDATANVGLNIGAPALSIISGFTVLL